MKAIWNWLASFTPSARSAPARSSHGTEDFLVQLERSWSDERGVGLCGWILSRHSESRPVEIWVGGAKASIVSWHERPEILAIHPQFQSTNGKCGFSAYIPHGIPRQLSLQIKTGGEFRTTKVSHPHSDPNDPPSPVADGGGLFARFVELANREKFRVLEIGSRVVSPGSKTKRELFPKVSTYVGFDYYPDANTDVVGDAHRLTSCFPSGTQFDGIFSISVLEHLAMPWVVAMEINKLLPKGGYTFHATHLAWPLHEMPWDFWRFTHEGLKVIFSPPLGFEVIEAGLFSPLRLHPDVVQNDTVLLPLERAFGGVAVLARKIADLDETKFRWAAPLESVVGTESRYPLQRVRAAANSTG